MVKDICSFLLLLFIFGNDLTIGLSAEDNYTCPRYKRSVDTIHT